MNYDYHRTLMYWRIGKGIFEEEQEGKNGAHYGKFLTKYIPQELEPNRRMVFHKDRLKFFA